MDIKDIANIIIDHVIDNERIYERSFMKKLRKLQKKY